MQTVLRFYAELKDFLADDRGSGTVIRTFDVPGSVKDVIEASGVPHTEVELILANGEPVDFSYRVADGDRISVYPVFAALDISSVVRVCPPAPRDLRFVLDGHLGRLAKYLRLLGFDTLYSNGWSDQELASISADSHRILLTRDVGLLKLRSVTHGYYLRATDPRRQLIEIVRRFRLTDHLLPFARCMECNGLLEFAGKADLADRLPPATRDNFNDFRICTTCERIYWRGSHFARLNEIVEEARRADR